MSVEEIKVRLMLVGYAWLVVCNDEENSIGMVQWEGVI